MTVVTSEKIPPVWFNLWNFHENFHGASEIQLLEEIRRLPVEVGSLFHYLTRLYTFQVVFSPDFFPVLT